MRCEYISRLLFFFCNLLNKFIYIILKHQLIISTLRCSNYFARFVINHYESIVLLAETSILILNLNNKFLFNFY